MDYYKIDIKKSTAKDLKKLPETFIKKIVHSIGELSNNPFPINCKKLKTSESLFRIKIGDYRVIYEVPLKRKQIMIHYIRHRKDVYRNL
jgi:mRNA interferase RelE/StbE